MSVRFLVGHVHLNKIFSFIFRAQNPNITMRAEEIKHYLTTGEELPPLGVRERVELAKRHLQLSLDLKGVPTGVYEMRRHLSCYFKGLPDFKETRMRLVTENDPQEVFRILDQIAEKWGETQISESSSVYGL